MIRDHFICSVNGGAWFSIELVTESHSAGTGGLPQEYADTIRDLLVEGPNTVSFAAVDTDGKRGRAVRTTVSVPYSELPLTWGTSAVTFGDSSITFGDLVYTP